MIVLNHGGSWAVPGDVELVRERVHAATMAAEGPLHELGAIAIVNSDSQGMGRIGETVRRTFQLAHVMKAWRRSGAAEGVPGLPADPGLEDPDDATTLRACCVTSPRSRSSRRSRTASPTTSARCGPDGSRTSCCGSPALFGVKPEWVFKGGFPAWGPMGEGNATVERAEPTRYRADWGGVATAAPKVAVTFVSRNVDAAGLARRLGTRRPWSSRRRPRPDPGLAARQPGDRAGRDRCRVGRGHARRPAARRRPGDRRSAQPPLPPAIGRRAMPVQVADGVRRRSRDSDAPTFGLPQLASRPGERIDLIPIDPDALRPRCRRP